MMKFPRPFSFQLPGGTWRVLHLILAAVHIPDIGTTTMHSIRIVYIPVLDLDLVREEREARGEEPVALRTCYCCIWQNCMYLGTGTSVRYPSDEYGTSTVRAAVLESL